MTAPPPPTEAPGTAAWGWRHINTAFDAADAAVITELCCIGLGTSASADGKYPSLYRARMRYAYVVHERQWAGWQCRLVWSILEAIVGTAEMDDIPF